MSSQNLQAVYARTSQGDTELTSPSNGLSINQRKLLQWADGQATVFEMAERLAAGHTVDAGKVVRDIERLQAANLIHSVAGGGVGAAAAPSAASASPAKKRGVPVWAYGAGAVVVLAAGVLLFGSRSGQTVKPTVQAAADPGAQPEEAPKILGVVPNPARWFSPAAPKPVEPPKPADTKPADKSQAAKPAAPAAVATAQPKPAAAAPAAAPAPAPVVAAAPAPAPAPVAAPAPAPTPAPVQVASAQPAAPKAPNTKPIFREQPQFPGEAARDGVESGVVKARMLVDTNGRVTKVDILEARPRRVFDRAVQTALVKWRFEAAASPFTVETEINFKAD